MQAVVGMEIMRGGSEGNAAIASLRAEGFPVMLDISASPRSALGGLPLPSDKLKVDLRSLPDGMGPGGELLKQLAARSKELGKPLVVAGVETEEQEELLRQLRPAGVQGFRYHRPMPIDDFAGLLERG